MKYIGIMIGVLSSLAAHAEKEVGNGGNAVVCYTDASKNEIKSIEMFDYWEMKQKYPEIGEIDLGPASLSVQEKIKIFMNRVSKFDAHDVKNEIEKYALLIANNIDNYLVESVPEINDDNSQYRPIAPCYKEQFAVQYQEVQSRRRFEINKSIYNNSITSNDTRAGIILHEAIYRFAITNFSHENSESSRTLNAAFASSVFQSKKFDLLSLLFSESKLDFEDTLCKYNNPKLRSPIYLSRSGFGLKYSPLDKYSFKDNNIEFSISENDLVSTGGCNGLTVNGKINTGVENRKWVKGIISLNQLSYLTTINQSHYQDLEKLKRLNFNTNYGVLKCLYGEFSIQTEKMIACLESGSDIQLPSQKNVWKNLKDIHFDESGNITKVETKIAPIDNGNSKYLTVIANTGLGGHLERLVRTVYLDSKGVVISGEFAKPKKSIINGYQALAYRFGPNPNTKKVEINFYTVKLKAIVDGVRILSNDWATQSFCKLYGFSGSSYNDNNSRDLEKISVLGEQRFYDFEEGRTVIKKDEVVEVFKNITCYKAALKKMNE